MAQQAWCPDCRQLRYQWEHSDNPDQCKKCESELEEEWPLHIRAWKAAATALSLAIGALLFAGPPVYVIYRAFQGGPLHETESVTRTVTETQHYGILPDIAPAVALWMLVILVTFAILHAPRRF